MEKSQMYFPVSPTIKHRIDATAKQLSIPASNIISEIVTQAFSQKSFSIKVLVPSTVHTSTNQEIEADDEKFAKGNIGEKHHLID